MEDMRIMYEMIGKKLLLGFLVIEAITILYVLRIYTSDDPLFIKIFLIVAPPFAVVATYFNQYFSYYKPLFRKWDKEDCLQSKYEWHYNKFLEKK